MIRFHGYFRSSAAYRCRIGFALKDVAYDFVPVHLREGRQREPAFRVLNPQGLVPAIESGGRVLTQSLAILEWLEETRPEPAFLPEDPFERADVRAFAQIIACDVHPLQNLRVLSHLRAEYGLDQAGVDAWCRRWIAEGLSACESLLDRRGEGAPFCFGQSPGLADICLVPQIFSAQRFGVDLSGLPKLMAIHNICNEIPAFASAHPARQPDREV